MKLKNRHLLVTVIIVVLVLGCGLLNGGSQLNKKVEELHTVFYNGENGDDLSLYYDLNKISDTISNTTSLAKLYGLEKDKTIKELKDLNQDFTVMDEMDTFQEWYEEVKELLPFAFAQIESESLTSQHKTMLNKYKATFDSAQHTIGYANFNKLVYAYEEETEGFLADVLRLLFNVEGVKAFD